MLLHRKKRLGIKTYFEHPTLRGSSKVSASGITAWIPDAAALQASDAAMQPLKESKARTIFIVCGVSDGRGV